MNTYQVELKRTSYVTITVEADSVEEAEERAWHDLADNAVNIDDSAWDLESIEELT